MQEYILSLSLGAIHRFMFICFEAFCTLNLLTWQQKASKHINMKRCMAPSDKDNIYSCIGHIIRKSCREGHILRILTLSIELFNYLRST
jgi:hypothetical protein